MVLTLTSYISNSFSRNDTCLSYNQVSYVTATAATTNREDAGSAAMMTVFFDRSIGLRSDCFMCGCGDFVASAGSQ